jgi:hypothetical protein
MLFEEEAHKLIKKNCQLLECVMLDFNAKVAGVTAIIDRWFDVVRVFISLSYVLSSMCTALCAFLAVDSHM